MKLTIDTLARAVPAGEELSMQKDLMLLARDAKSVLGYTLLAEQMLGMPLREALTKLQMETLDEDEIRRYQRQVLEEKLQREVILEGDGRAARVMMDDEDEEDDDEEDDDDRPKKVKDAYEDGEDVESPKKRSLSPVRVEWGWTQIGRYEKPIPEFVLNKAVTLKREIPMVELFIEEVKKVPLRDPFLVAVLGKERFYLEVWNEPKFEGRITKEEKRKMFYTVRRKMEKLG